MTLDLVRRVAFAAAGLVSAGLLAAPAAMAGTGESITASLATQSPHVNNQLEIDGQVSGATMYPATVTVSRTDSSGTTALDAVPTDNTGNFTVTDSPPVRGQVTYDLAAQGSTASTEVVAHVAGDKVNLALTTKHGSVAAGRTVSVTAHLSGASGATVTIYATPYQGSRHQIGSGPVDGNGNRSAPYTVNRRTVFSVRYAGDDTHDPAAATRLVKAWATIAEKLHGGYATRHHVRLYHPGSQPLLVARRQPTNKGACLYFRAEHYYSGSWHTSTVSQCIHTDSQGYAAGALTGNHVVGEPYRIRAEWRGSRALLAHAGAWLRLKFHR